MTDREQKLSVEPECRQGQPEGIGEHRDSRAVALSPEADPTPKYVYLALADIDYEPGWVLGVFATIEDAMTACENDVHGYDELRVLRFTIGEAGSDQDISQRRRYGEWSNPAREETTQTDPETYLITPNGKETP